MNYTFNFKKKYGQNFLKNEAIIKNIVDVATIKPNSCVIEVGPGLGALTKKLAIANDKVEIICYEIDYELEDVLTVSLKEYSNITVFFGDFLKQDIKKNLQSFKYKNLYFVSNVPYYITTPIIFKLIKSDLQFTKIVMMVQKEVAERFCANPGRKEYGALTVLLQYYFNVKKEFLVDKNQFVPKPNVDSMVVSFTPKEKKEIVYNEIFFEKFVHDCFKYKRKTLRNNLRKYDLNIVEKVLMKYNYDLNVRAEQLDYFIFVEISNALS